MSNRQIDQRGRERLALAGGTSGMPPGGATPEAVANGNRPPTLTEFFNQAAMNADQSTKASRPVWRHQLTHLRRQLSQPRLTYEMLPLGSVNRAYNPKADRKIVKRIKDIEERLEAAKGLTDRFTLAEKKNQLKQTFHRSAGMGM